MLKNHFKVALRNLIRRKNHAFINIGGLSIGIAVCFMIFIITQFESSFDDYHEKKDRVYRVLTEYHHAEPEIFYGSGVPYPLPLELKSSFPELQKVSAIYSEGDDQIIVLDLNGNPVKKFKEEQGVFLVEPELFDILDYTWLAGEPATLEGLNNVVLTKETAEKYFDNWEHALGRTIKWNDNEVLTVTGILGTIPVNTDLQFKAVISYGTGYTSNFETSDNWNGTNGSFGCYVLLPSNVSESDINGRLNVLSKEKKTGRNKDIQVLQSLDKVHYDARTGNFSGKAISQKLINILWLIGAFILLIACINFINLSTAQAVNRSKEIGVRKVIGGTRVQLKAQFMIETLLIVILAACIAFLIVLVFLPQMAKLLDLPLSITPVLNIKTFVLSAGIIVAVTFLAGFYPSLVLSKFNPISALKNQSKVGKNEGLALRRGLVVFQFAIAQVLIFGTLIIVEQMDYFTNQSMGYDKEAIVNVSIPTDSVSLSKMNYLSNSLMSLNGVENVSFSSNTPTEYRTDNWTRFVYDNASEDTDFYSIRKGIDHNYLETYGLSLIAGRNVKKPSEGTEILVNEDLMKRLGIVEPNEILNKKASLAGGRIEGEIVGVVKDYHSSTFKDGMSSIIMVNRKTWFGLAGIKLTTSTISNTLGEIEKIWGDSFPNYAFDYQFLDHKIADFYAEESKLSHLYKLFAVIAILLSCLGLYGLASFMVNQRIKEAGIRKVLGATVVNIVYLFSKEFIVLITIAFLIAAPTAWYFMMQWLEEYTYHIDITWVVFILGGMAALTIALSTISFQAIKAANANPVNSLRTE
ncbi:FtsX-like permease family protein [Maribacter sp. 2307UL18-2]|uniref:ABC transporter permease n=1 Tax=Maribacter sp. 2307UL18-2 TaxID=3386274 RepID=UPI0039BCB472